MNKKKNKNVKFVPYIDTLAKKIVITVLLRKQMIELLLSGHSRRLLAAPGRDDRITQLLESTRLLDRRHITLHHSKSLPSSDTLEIRMLI